MANTIVRRSAGRVLLAGAGLALAWLTFLAPFALPAAAQPVPLPSPSCPADMPGCFLVTIAGDAVFGDPSTDRTVTFTVPAGFTVTGAVLVGHKGEGHRHDAGCTPGPNSDGGAFPCDQNQPNEGVRVFLNGAEVAHYADRGPTFDDDWYAVDPVPLAVAAAGTNTLTVTHDGTTGSIGSVPYSLAVALPPATAPATATPTGGPPPGSTLTPTATPTATAAPATAAPPGSPTSPVPPPPQERESGPPGADRTLVPLCELMPGGLRLIYVERDGLRNHSSTAVNRDAQGRPLEGPCPTASPTATATSTPTATPRPTSTPAATASTTPTTTSTPTPRVVPSPTATVTPLAAESEPTPVPTAQPTPVPEIPLLYCQANPTVPECRPEPATSGPGRG
jgi:hypothetical protein